MAEYGFIQEVRYGNLAAVYNGLPFTLTHWSVDRRRVLDPAGESAGEDRTYDLSGYIEAADAAAWATARNNALAILGADGGDFRVQVPRIVTIPLPGYAWHTIEELLSADTQDGIQVEDLRIDPAGGYRLNVSVKLRAWVPASDGDGLIWSLWRMAEADDDAGRPTWSFAGQIKTRVGAGVGPREYFDANVLDGLLAICPFAASQHAVAAELNEDGTLLTWQVVLSELLQPYPGEAGKDSEIRDGERTITRTRDEHHGLTLRDEGTYTGPGALDWVRTLVADKPDALRWQYSYTRHKAETVSWSVETLYGTDGHGSICVRFQERFSQTRGIGAETMVKQYASSEPLLIVPASHGFSRSVHEGQAVSDSPDVWIAPPEANIPGRRSAPAEISMDRLNAHQNVTTWRYETIDLAATVQAAPVPMPRKRDYGAGLAWVVSPWAADPADPAGKLKAIVR